MLHPRIKLVLQADAAAVLQCTAPWDHERHPHLEARAKHACCCCTLSAVRFYCPVSQVVVHGSGQAQAVAAACNSRRQSSVAAGHVPRALVGHDHLLAKVPGDLALLQVLVTR